MTVRGANSIRAALRRIPLATVLVGAAGVRAAAMVVQIGVAVALVALRGAAVTGDYFADVSAIALVAIVARVGLPTLMARRANLAVRLRRPPQPPAEEQSVPPQMPGLVLMVFPLAALLAFGVGAAFGRPSWELCIGAGLLALGQCFAGWVQGSERQVAAAGWQHLPAPVATAAAMLLGFEPIIGHVIGLALAAVALGALVGAGAGFGGSIAAADVVSTVLLGGSELTNQLATLLPPLVLANYATLESAAVFGFAVRMLRPMSVARYAVSHTYGARLAGTTGQTLTDADRRLATTMTALLTAMAAAYAVVALPLAWLFQRGWSPAGPIPGYGGLSGLVAAWGALTLSALVNAATGPTGQLLAMRGHGGWSMAAAVVGLMVAPVALVLPGSPATQAAWFASLAGVVQTALAALLVGRLMGWSGWGAAKGSNLMFPGRLRDGLR